MRLLLYYQASANSISLLTLLQGFKREGHEVYFLTISEKGILHQNIESLGIETFSSDDGAKKISYFHHLKYLIFFCRKYKIDAIFSHLQNANLIALLAKYIMHVKVIPTRHHLDDVILAGNKNAKRIDYLVNLLSKKLVVVSNPVKTHLVKNEKVNEERIKVITLAYDLNFYDKPDLDVVNAIKKAIPCQLRLIMISRMTKNKNHILLLECFNNLIKKGYDIKLIIMDSGPEEDSLRSYVKLKGLDSKVVFTGFQNKIINYLSASDLLVHPSISEASNQVVREAALLKIPSIVVEDVGDFNEYIIPYENGFVVSKENIEIELKSQIQNIYLNRCNLIPVGNRIQETIVNKFFKENSSIKYLELIK